MQSAEFLLNFAAMVLGAGAVYGAIRADLKHLAERLAQNEQRVNSLTDHLLNKGTTR